MQPDRIAELLAPFLTASTCSSAHCHSEERSDEESAVLAPAQLQSISTYIDILQRWNARVNLTSIRDEEQIITRHFGESLFAARHLFPSLGDAGTAAPGWPGRASDSAAEAASAAEWRKSAVPGIDATAERRERAVDGASRGIAPSGEPAAEQRKRITAADLGSGAGFPGIPIKLWAPHISLTLIESNHKKATFLREVVRALTLTDVDIQNVRAESLPDESFDIVTLRAVERFETILPIANALLAPGGRLALLIGASQLPSAQALLPALNWSIPLPIPNSTSRILTVATDVWQ